MSKKLNKSPYRDHTYLCDTRLSYD